jgi:flagellar biosynthesis/type III secretory pathway chaperone
MDASHEKSYAKLLHSLEDLTKLYRSLLEIVRKEKEYLVSADIEKLQISNQEKESTLYKIRTIDGARERYAKELAGLIGTDVAQPRLLDMARVIQGTEGERLRAIHATLDLLVKRTADLNRENEIYAKSALETLNGAMNDIKETLAGKKTYARQGKMATGPDQAGNFVSKEA